MPFFHFSRTERRNLLAIALIFHKTGSSCNSIPIQKKALALSKSLLCDVVKYLLI